jgi:hypothetical protein
VCDIINKCTVLIFFAGMYYTECPRRKGHSVDHCKQEKVYYIFMRPIPNGFRGRDILLYISKITDKKKILDTDSYTGIYCSSYKAGAVYLV